MSYHLRMTEEEEICSGYYEYYAPMKDALMDILK
jgi:hypothetical protein